METHRSENLLLVFLLIILALIAMGVAERGYAQETDDDAPLTGTASVTQFLQGPVFGGENKLMITEALYIPTGSYTFEPFGGFVSIEQKDLTAVVGAVVLVAVLVLFLNRSKMGRAIRALGDDHQAALSVGISLSTIPPPAADSTSRSFAITSG